MTHLTRQLLSYAQGAKSQPCLTTVNKLVEDTMPALRRAVAPSVSVVADLCEPAIAVEMDATQMQMVLAAIVTNAAEAMSGDGIIRLRSENFTVPAGGTNSVLGVEHGTYVRLCIEDSGRGMDETTKRRMFEPFFSTKFQGRGLSMAAVLGIIKNHHGWIDVDTEPGRGTTVQINLPAAKPAEGQGNPGSP
jgi:signal transduction histidine kinase